MSTGTSLTSAGLIKAANEALVKVSKDINIIKLFAYDLSNEAVGNNSTIKVPVIDGGTAVVAFSSNSNDYETLTGTVSYVPVTLNTQVKATFKFDGLDTLDTPNAPYWSKCAEAGATSVSKYISSTFGGLFTAPATGGVEFASVTKANLAKLRNSCAGRIADTVLALAPAEYAEMLALFDTNVYGGYEAVRNGMVPGLYGFKAVVELRDAGEGVKGALIPSNAIAIASRAVAVGDQSIYSEFGNVTDENGFTLTTFRHGSAAKGTGFINIACQFGMAKVQPDAIKILVAPASDDDDDDE